MKLRYHALPRTFDVMAAGGGGTDAVRELAQAQYSKHLLLLRGVLRAAEAVGDTKARPAREGYDLLAAVQNYDPFAAEATIRYPSVGAWAQRTLRALQENVDEPGAKPARLCAVAAAAAVRAGMAAEVEVPAIAGTVVLPSLGAAVVNGSTATVQSAVGMAGVRWAHSRVEIPPDPHQDGPGWLGLRRIHVGEFSASLDDLDPFRMPAVPGLAPRLSSREADALTRAIQRGWRLLAANHPSVAAEVAAAIAVIVPLGGAVHAQDSFSSREAFAAIALSPPPDPFTCAVTLAHEVQHLKLCALLDVVDLTHPDDGRRFYAPWRPDPRPIDGLLQGAYAYLGVSGFWRTERHLTVGPMRMRANREFALWRAGVARVIDTLQETGRLTAAGRDFVQGMSKTVGAWQRESVPADARAAAYRQAESHLSRWESDNWLIRA